MTPIEFDIPARSMWRTLQFASKKDLRRLAKEMGTMKLGRTKADLISNIVAERVNLRVTVEA